MKSFVVQHDSRMVLSSQVPELTAFSMHFYFKPISFLDAVYEILAFKKIHSCTSENIYIRSTQRSNVGLALKGQAAHEN